MATEIQQSKDTCIDHLTVTGGTELEIMANLKTAGQVDAVIEGHICKALGSAFGMDTYETLLRCSVSWQGRGRDDLTGIGKTPDMPGGFQPRITDI